MRKTIFNWLGREFISLSGEARKEINPAEEIQELLQSFSRVTLRNGVEPNPPRLIKGFKRIVLHPEKAQDAQESLKLYRQIFGLP